MSNVTNKQKKDKLKGQLVKLMAKLQTIQEKVKEPNMKNPFNLFNRSIIHRDNYAQIGNLKRKIDNINRKLTILEV